MYVSRKTLLVVALVSRRVNLSAHFQCVIQKPLRMNTQPQLQFSELHHTLASPTQATHHLPYTHLQTYAFLAIYFSNLERMFVNMCPFSNHQDQDSIIATTSPDILTRISNLYGEPPLASTNPPTQIRKTTLDYPCTPKVYILLKSMMGVIPWSESKPGLKW